MDFQSIVVESLLRFFPETDLGLSYSGKPCNGSDCFDNNPDGNPRLDKRLSKVLSRSQLVLKRHHCLAVVVLKTQQSGVFFIMEKDGAAVLWSAINKLTINRGWVYLAPIDLEYALVA